MPETAAGRRLIAAYPGNDLDASSPEFIRYHAGRIDAIEAEARALGRAEALREMLDEFGPVTFGPGCSEYDHPIGCQCPYPVAAAERDRLRGLAAIDNLETPHMPETAAGREPVPDEADYFGSPWRANPAIPETPSARKMVAIHGSVLLDDALGIEAEARALGRAEALDVQRLKRAWLNAMKPEHNATCLNDQHGMGCPVGREVDEFTEKVAAEYAAIDNLETP